MAHIAFIDTNVPELDAMRRAREVSHRVSFAPALPRLYPDRRENLAIIAGVDHSPAEALEIAERIGYPVVAKPLLIAHFDAAQAAGRS